MKKISLISLFMGCILMCSCQDVKKTPHQMQMYDLNKKYHEEKAFFKDNLTSHFPDSINVGNISFSQNISPKFGSLELTVIDSLDKAELIQIKKNCEQTCIGKYKASDSCLLVLNRFLSMKKFYNVENSDYDKKLIDRPCYIGKFPVPNFWHNDFTTNETECKLPGDFIIYVIDAKPGKYLKKELLTNGWFMPTKWINGYSKGVAISQQQNVIIYWLEIW